MFQQKKLTFLEFKIVFIVTFAATCGALGIDLHLASMPYIMHFMHTDKAHMQQSVSVYLFGLGFSLLFYGPLSDQYGRRPIIIVGLLFASLSSFIAAFTHSIHVFLLMRLLQGAGSGVCMGLGRTVIADVLQGDRMAVTGSYLNLFSSLSPLFGPALGGYIQRGLDWQANFIVLGFIFGLSLFLYAYFCPETNQYKNPRAFSMTGLYQNYKDLLLHPLFLGCACLTGIGMAASMTYATVSSFVFQIQFHVAPVMYGWLTAIAGVGGLVGKLLVPVLLFHFGRKKMVLSGAILMLLAGIWIAVFLLLHHINVALILVSVFLTIVGQVFMGSVAASRAISPFHTKRGAAGALYGSFQMLTAFLVSALVGLLAHDGVLVLAVSYCVLGMLAMFVYTKIFKLI